MVADGQIKINQMEHKSIYIPLFPQNNNIVLVNLYPESTNLVQSKLLGSDSNEFFEGPNFINKVKYVFFKVKISIL